MLRSRLTATLPWTSRHVWPPSGWGEPFGSPVPAYRVRPLRSVGSIRIEPIELDCMPADEECQRAGTANASSVIQMPPPAEATYRRQLPATQVGAIASAVTRPESVVCRPV